MYSIRNKLYCADCGVDSDLRIVDEVEHDFEVVLCIDCFNERVEQDEEDE